MKCLTGLRIRCWIAAAALSLGACAGMSSGQPRSDTFAADASLMQEQPERLIVLAVANPREPLLMAGSTQPAYAGTHRYRASSNARAVLHAVKAEYGLREVAEWPINALQLHCVVLEIASGTSRDELLAILSKDKRIALAQPLQTFGTLSEKGVGYNDPYVDLQAGFVAIDAAQAHLASRGKGVKIAIIDTGVDTAHPDLKGRVSIVRNFVDLDQVQFGRDRHGTEIAGIIAAVANNRQGVVGVAPEAELAVYKACWHLKTGSQGARCNSFTLAQALAASIDEGAQVINLSLAGPLDDLLARLLTVAMEKGSIVVGAMPSDGRAAGFPSGVAGVIVADVAHREGARPSGVVIAPGRDILTLQPEGHYDFDSGSSLAAAHASAAVALLLSADPRLDVKLVRSLLTSSQSLPGSGASFSACGALASLRKEFSCGVQRARTPPATLSEAVSSK